MRRDATKIPTIKEAIRYSAECAAATFVFMLAYVFCRFDKEGQARAPVEVIFIMPPLAFLMALAQEKLPIFRPPVKENTETIGPRILSNRF